MTGKRNPNAVITADLFFRDIWRSLTRYIDIENNNTSIIISKAVMSCHRTNRLVHFWLYSTQGWDKLHFKATMKIDTMAHTIDDIRAILEALI